MTESKLTHESALGQSRRRHEPTGQASRLRPISSILTGARIAGALAGFATQVLLARTLQAHALGVFFSVTSLAAVVGLICAHGYPAIAARFISRYREQGKEDLIAAFVGESFHVAAISVAIATIAVLAGAVLWPSFNTRCASRPGRRRSVDPGACLSAAERLLCRRDPPLCAELSARHLHQAVSLAWRRAGSDRLRSRRSRQAWSPGC